MTRSADDDLLSTAQVSAALGVSVTTVKRWVDDAILPAYRTAGGHRKLHRADIQRMIRDGQFAADASKLMPADAASLSARFSKAVRCCDVQAVPEILRAAYAGGLPVETIADAVIGPGMVLLGSLWESGTVDVSHEHRFSQACQSALFELKAQLRGQAPRGPLAVGGSPEGDYSILPNLLAEMALLDRGWRVINLGPHTPFEAFESVLEREKPKLIWLSVTHIAGTDFESNYRRFFAKAASQQAAVALGGSALTDDVRKPLPYTTFGDGLTHLTAFAATLHQTPQRPKRGRPLAMPE